MNITGKNLVVLKSSLERALDDCLTELGHSTGESQGNYLEVVQEIGHEMKRISDLLNRCNKELEKNHGS